MFASVIVPTYNQAKFLPAALDSLLAQTDSDWEAIVVNDGSTDETSEIAESYSRRDARIRCIHKPNGGVASALNAGLASVRGEWIHWLSSDDMFEPNKLEINRLWIERHPEAKFYFSYFTLLRDTTGVREKRDLWGPLPDPAHQILTLFYRNYISGISICVNHEAWRSVGYFDESLRYAQDYDQWLRLLQRYQGCFISEWTVISRNHADQGSETFPDACYFDTAKAAINFINEHSFKELVPFLDFNNQEVVRKAVLYALDVASDRTAFLYSSGSHPALVMRILEWVFSAECNDAELRTQVRLQIAKNSLTDGNDDWVWMWRQLATAIHPENRVCSYHPIAPLTLKLREYRQRRLIGDCSAMSLYDYLVKFESAKPEELEVLGSNGPRLVILVEEDKNIEFIAPVLTRLAEKGCRNLVLVKAVVHNSPVWQQYTWGELICVSTYDRDCLPWLGEVELVVTLPGVTIPIWLGGVAGIELLVNESADRIEKYVCDIFFSPSNDRRPVVFLERVLLGGGAERVVLDIARYLDRRLYKSIIVTMFDEHTEPPELPLNVEIYSCREIVCPDLELSNSTIKMDARRSLGSMMHCFYHRIVSDSLRSKLQIGQRLVSLRQKMSRYFKRGRHTSKRDADLSNTRCVEMYDDCALDYIGAALHHNANAESVSNLVTRLGGDTVVVTAMEEAAVTAWLAQGGRKFPYIVSLHTLESQCMLDIYRSSKRRRAESHWLTTSCNYANAVTLPSDGCVKDLQNNFSVSGHNIHKLWNPIDCAMVRRLSFYQDYDAELWRDHASGFRLIHVGRLDPQKNHDLLLDTCSELKKREINFSLAIVGEGHDRQRIEKRIKSLGIGGEVTLIGERKNPFPWIKAANALVLTSRFEAFSLVLVEAMACGTPVVSVDCSAGPAEVLANGEYGLLVPNNDPAALADAVERLMVDPEICQQLVIRGYERVKEFDIKRIVHEWQSLIDNVS